MFYSGGGNASTGGNAAAVQVTAGSTIITNAAHPQGTFAESFVGGGGDAGTSSGLVAIGAGGSGGDGEGTGLSMISSSTARLVAREAERFDAGLKLAVSRNAAFFTTFNGEFSDTGSSYAGTVGFRINW